MKLSHWLKTREGALAESKISRPIILLLAFTCLVLAFGLVRKSETVVMVPSTLEERAWVSKSSASAEMQVAQGLSLALLLGNVTPGSAEFVSSNISRSLSPRMYRPILEAIDREVRELRDEQISVSFTPTLARFDPDVDRVVITGEVITRGLRGSERREIRTYEMGFSTRNHTLLLDHMRVMEGTWRRQRSNEQGS